MRNVRLGFLDYNEFSWYSRMCNLLDFKAREFLLGNSLSQTKHIGLSGFNTLISFIGMLLQQSLAINAPASVLLQTLELFTDVTEHKYSLLEVIFKDAEALFGTSSLKRHISILLKHYLHLGL